MPFSRRGMARLQAFQQRQQQLREQGGDETTADAAEAAAETADLVPISAVTRRGVTIEAPAGSADRSMRRLPPPVAAPRRAAAAPAAPASMPAGDKAELIRRIDALAAEVEMLRGHCNVLFGTTSHELPFYAAVPMTENAMRDLVEGTVTAGTKCRLSYPQRPGALGIEFMQVHLVDDDTGSTSQFWIPVCTTADTDPEASTRALGTADTVFFDAPFTNVP